MVCVTQQASYTAIKIEQIAHFSNVVAFTFTQHTFVICCINSVINILLIGTTYIGLKYSYFP